MIKFILHGGAAGKPGYNNDKFYKEIIDSTEDPLKIVLVLFAREQNDWQALASEYQLRFVARAGERAMNFTVASEDMDAFSQQIKNSNIIYLAGGNTAMLQAQLQKITDFKTLLTGKVVAGTSAGALVFSKFYYDNDTQEISAGLGLLDIKLITHYSPALQTESLKLSFYKEDLTLYEIPETEFLTISLV